MSREPLQRGQLTEKDMSVLREGDDARTQSKSSFGVVKDYTLKHSVSFAWNLNEEAEKDRIFKMMVDDYEVILDAEEVMRLLRWV